jgi:hypothetical protein
MPDYYSKTSHCDHWVLFYAASVRYAADDPWVERTLGVPSNRFPKPYARLWLTYILGPLSHSNSNGCFLTLGIAPHARGSCAIREDAVFLHSIYSKQLATLAAHVSLAEEATPELLSEIVAKTARRLSAPGAAQLDQLIEASALTEAAFGLINLELPLWKMRRITYDEGEWHCAMSRQRELPEWLD